jgi:hypothetical protein
MPQQLRYRKNGQKLGADPVKKGLHFYDRGFSR